MWSSLENFVGKLDAAWVICGDFNEVRDQSKRQNCVFLDRRAKWFNEFINKTHLIEVPLCGKRFTRICDNTFKFSKLDGFLIFEKFNHVWGDLSVFALERKISDHSPIILRDKDINFGPKPIKIFDKWIKLEGTSKIIEDAWKLNVEGRRLDSIFRIKLKNVKNVLKEWSQNSWGCLDFEIENLKADAAK
ncbi:uncharacterized protein [Rutidosis leptorrhynchoides]|uniref:uncharacterized protein n=1 Tax=Rutidosis leptorrhynchoides TaxID=125765 RepID=UPI003A99F62A